MHSVDLPVSPEIEAEFGAEFIQEAEAIRARVHARPEADCAATNRANAQHSTGPRTAEGKQRSAANSFKHGLYSKAVVNSSENPAEFHALCEDLRAEHQPANTTESILVQELADHFWRLRRARALESWAWEQSIRQNHLNVALLQLIQRTMSAAERGFHRALTALTKLQKERGFVPAKAAPAAAEPAPAPAKQAGPAAGFVPAKSTEHAAHAVQCTPAAPSNGHAAQQNASPVTSNGNAESGSLDTARQ